MEERRPYPPGLESPSYRVCKERRTEHRLSKPYHTWTSGQAERMKRTIKEATIKTFQYESQERLKAHIISFVNAYNFAKHLEALRCEAIYESWVKNPPTFKADPHHFISGLYNPP